jgi:alanyl-tRNA synthetase
MRDLRTKNALLMRLSASLSVGTEELELAVSRTRESEDRVSKELMEARGQLLIHEANALAQQAIVVGEIRFVKLQSPARSLEELRILAQLIAGHGCVAILAMATDKGHLIIARGPGIPIDSNIILKAALATLGGRGGGRPELAQGGIADASQVPVLLEQASNEAMR